MENRFSPEEKAELALKSLDEISAQEAPAGLEAKMMARFDMEFPSSGKAQTPKWFWAAAVFILACNVLAAYKYSSSSSVPKTESAEIRSMGSYFFQGGTDWYNGM